MMKSIQKIYSIVSNIFAIGATVIPSLELINRAGSQIVNLTGILRRMQRDVLTILTHLSCSSMRHVPRYDEMFGLQGHSFT